MTQYVDDHFLVNRYNAGRRTIWRWAKNGLLPQPVKLSPGCTRWRLDEIEARDAKLEAARSRAA